MGLGKIIKYFNRICSIDDPLVCHKCHTAKKMKMPIFMSLITVEGLEHRHSGWSRVHAQGSYASSNFRCPVSRP